MASKTEMAAAMNKMSDRPGAREREDVKGNKFYVGDLGGCTTPMFPAITDFTQHGRDIRDMELNAGDVLIIGYPKTGSHWLTSIITMLMEGSTQNYGQSTGGIFLDRTPIHSPLIPPPDHPRVIFTHVTWDFLPKQVKEKNVKLVYLERNPKDTWVSFYNFSSKLTMYPSSWGDFVEQMLDTGLWYGDWFQYVLQYEKDIERERAAGHPIFVNHFEDLKKDPVGGIEKLDAFLGYNRGRELCEQIAKACNFSTMKSAISKEVKKDLPKGFSDTLMRKGEVADWKNWFTVAQNERFDHKYSAQMKGSKIQHKFV